VIKEKERVPYNPKQWALFVFAFCGLGTSYLEHGGEIKVL
jgi:hypothetical protein